MCLTIPGKVSKVDKKGFEIDYKSDKVKIANSLIKNVKVGDWVLVQNKFVVQKMTEQQANEFFRLTK